HRGARVRAARCARRGSAQDRAGHRGSLPGLRRTAGARSPGSIAARSMSSDIPKPSASPRGLVSDRQAEPLPPPLVRELTRLAERALSAEGVADTELSLSFVDEDEMAELHERYLREPGPTDVLSFPLGEDGLLGDVIVCPA